MSEEMDKNPSKYENKNGTWSRDSDSWGGIGTDSTETWNISKVFNCCVKFLDFRTAITVTSYHTISYKKYRKTVPEWAVAVVGVESVAKGAEEEEEVLAEDVVVLQQLNASFQCRPHPPTRPRRRRKAHPLLDLHLSSVFFSLPNCHSNDRSSRVVSAIPISPEIFVSQKMQYKKAITWTYIYWT